MERSTPNLRRHSAFTLVELLAVAVVVGVLCALVTAVVGRVKDGAARTREVTAARQLISGYHLAASDLRGRLMPGFAGGRTATAEDGSGLAGNIVAARWPHHLRPYLGDRFLDTLYVGEQRAYYERTVKELAGNPFMREYQLGIATSFGMNARFVGGDGALLLDPPLTRLNQAARPGDLVAFAASRARQIAPDAGHWTVAAPAYWTLPGQPREDDARHASDQAYGYLAPRGGNQVTVAWLDGSVRCTPSAELRDMRLWSDAARRLDAPRYVPPAAP